MGIVAQEIIKGVNGYHRRYDPRDHFAIGLCGYQSMRGE